MSIYGSSDSSDALSRDSDRDMSLKTCSRAPAVRSTGSGMIRRISGSCNVQCEHNFGQLHARDIPLFSWQCNWWGLRREERSAPRFADWSATCNSKNSFANFSCFTRRSSSAPTPRLHNTQYARYVFPRHTQRRTRRRFRWWTRWKLQLHSSRRCVALARSYYRSCIADP